MKNKIVISLLLASTLSSCHIYRTYERPESITVSDSLYRQPTATEDTTSLASLSWKELFTDHSCNSSLKRDWLIIQT